MLMMDIPIKHDGYRVYVCGTPSWTRIGATLSAIEKIKSEQESSGKMVTLIVNEHDTVVLQDVFAVSRYLGVLAYAISNEAPKNPIHVRWLLDRILPHEIIIAHPLFETQPLLKNIVAQARTRNIKTQLMRT